MFVDFFPLIICLGIRRFRRILSDQPRDFVKFSVNKEMEPLILSRCVFKQFSLFPEYCFYCLRMLDHKPEKEIQEYDRDERESY